MFSFRNICLFVLLFSFRLDLVYGHSFFPVLSPDRIMLEENSIVIGAKNSIFRLNTDCTEYINIQDLTPSEVAYGQCLRNGWPAEDCHNEVSIMLSPTSTELVYGTDIRQNDTIFTCTTNAYSPQCSYVDINTLQTIHSFNGDNYISSENQYQSAHLFTSVGDLFTYRQEGLGEDYVISKHLQPLSPDSLVRTRNFYQTSLWLNEAEIVSMYEEGDFVYIFFREKAVEVTTRISQNEQIYSRVARICKNDLGSGGTENHFLSFQKARISCVYQQTSQTPTYHYNELYDTFKLSGSYYHSSSSFEQVYAIFSSPVNGPVGSAVCVYTFDKNDFDLVKAFRGRYIDELSAYTWGFSSEKGDIDCKADPIRTTEEARRNVIMQFSVKQAHQSEPLFHLNNQKFVKIVVDRIKSLDGSYYEVMFILAISYESTIDILLHRVTYIADRQSQSNLISTNIVVKDASDLFVTEMKLYKNVENRTQEGVIVGTRLGIHKLPLQSCQTYTSAKECVEAMDPYCVFSCKQQECMSIYNINTSGDYFLYNYTSGEVWTCPAQYSPPGVNSSSQTRSPDSTTTTIRMSTTTTTTVTTPIDPVDGIFPLIQLPPVHIEYLIISVLTASALFCCLGVCVTICCIKLTIQARKLGKNDYLQTEMNTFGSDESSPLPKQFWESTATPYEVPLNEQLSVFSQNQLNSYKPSHMQSSPSINTSHSLAYAFHPPRSFNTSIITEPLVKNKFVSSTLPRSHSPITSVILPPLPARVNSNGFLLHPSLQPPNSPSSAATFHQLQLSNKYKRGFSEMRSFTPDFLSTDRRSKSEI